METLKKFENGFIPESRAFDIFTECMGRYPESREELESILGYVAPLVQWDAPIAKGASLRQKQGWFARLKEWW